jgi:hypothetical protein
LTIFPRCCRCVLAAGNPFGLIHGPITYLLGKRPDRDDQPYLFRLDRMRDVSVSETLGCPPEDWDLDAWLADSFGIWRESGHDIVLRVRPDAVERAKGLALSSASAVEGRRR